MLTSSDSSQEPVLPPRTRRPRSWRTLTVLLLTVAVAVAVLGGLLFVYLPHRLNSPYVYHPTSGTSAVTTYRGDNSHSGWYANETALTVKSVSSGNFGHQVSYPVDGQIYAQPLFVPNLKINGRLYNVVFVATEHDSVYAFDADQVTAQPPLWQTSFLKSGVTTAAAAAVFGSPSGAIAPEVGITSTPVIDSKTGTLYVVATTSEHNQIVQRLHALDISTGRTLRSVLISASVPGTGVGSVNGTIAFNAQQELQRSALLLVNGVVYVAWASYGDREPFHGWLMGYDAATLHQSAVLNTTPNGVNGGIWSSGGAVTARDDGSIFFASGDGTFDLDKGGQDGGDTVYRVDGHLKRLDYFTPDLQAYYSKYDLDIGSAGVMLLPPQSGAQHPHLLVASGKDGRIYLLDQDNLGHFNKYPDLIVQELPARTMTSVFSTPAYWQGPTSGYVYFAGVGDYVTAFGLRSGLLTDKPVSRTTEKFTYPGGNPVVSSNGNLSGTGIVWVVTPSGDARNGIQPGILHAYDATNLSHELFKGSFPQFVKFSVPTVANGKVFVGSGNSLQIFGLSK